MAGHPNLALMQRSYEALASGDVQFLESTSAPEFTFTVSGASAISGTANSVAEAAAEFGRSMELCAGDMDMQPRHLLADDDVGFAVFDVTASRPDGRQIKQSTIHEWQFTDGKVTRIREWIWDQAADVEFWS